MSVLCEVPGCTRQRTRSCALCPMHYSRKRKTGDVGPPHPMVNVGSGRAKASTGYMRLHRPGHPLADRLGWVPEHRFVAYEMGWLPAGRPDLHVHHKNHDKLDNRPENLAVLTSAEHRAQHRSEQLRETLEPSLTPRRRVLDGALAARLYLAGLTTVEVAERLGSHAGNISRALAAEGVKARPTDLRFKLDEDLVVRMLQFGVPARAVAAHFECSPIVVGRIKRERGVAPRRPGRPSKSTPDVASFLAVSS